MKEHRIKLPFGYDIYWSAEKIAVRERRGRLRAAVVESLIERSSTENPVNEEPRRFIAKGGRVLEVKR